MRFVLERVSEPDIEPITAAEFVRNVGEFDVAATTRADDITRLITAARVLILSMALLLDHRGRGQLLRIEHAREGRANRLTPVALEARLRQRPLDGGPGFGVSH